MSNKQTPQHFHFHSQSEEIFRIEESGDLYWRGRLIESDEDFKASMIDLLQFFRDMNKEQL